MAEKWRLGVVESPEPGHELAVGRLAIPYQNKLGVIGFKFRCLVGHECKETGCPKYVQPVGQEDYLFNVLATDEDSPVIHITEGEFDAVVLDEVLGEPVCAVSGASKWKPHYPWHFKGWERVVAWPDGDKAGSDMAGRLRKEVPGVEVVQMPSGHDVTSLYLELGAEALLKLAGRGEEDDSDV